MFQRSHSSSILSISILIFLHIGLVGCGKSGAGASSGASGSLSIGDRAEDRSRPSLPDNAAAAFEAPYIYGADSLAASEIEDLVAGRKRELLEDYLADPFPDPNSDNPSTRCWGRAGYALAAFKTGTGTALAEQYIQSIRDEFLFSDDGALHDPPCYFTIPLLWRTYLDPESHARLSENARESLLKIMWSFINSRSKLSDADGSVWIISSSENHDALQKSAYLLASRALMQAESYGPKKTLADGEELQTHYAAWSAYWFEYFRERALEGISVEVASPTYAKYSLAAYYGVRDFAGDAALESRASDFLALYWADVAQDFLPSTGVRGGAATRVYKDKYLTRGGRQSIRDWSYIYHWHDNYDGRSHPISMIAASSSYSPPDLLRDQATDPDRSHIYTSRRFGMGSSVLVDRNPIYRVRFDGELGSQLIRTTHVTSDFAIGAMSYSSNHVFNRLTGQNRSMGVQLASDPSDQIIIHGRGTHDGGRIGFHEINGIVTEGVLVVARDPRFEQSDLIRVFIPHGELWNNRIERDGWFFTYAGESFVAIRMPEAGYKLKNVDDGMMLDQRDSWTPILIQMGQARDYTDFAAFQDSVLQNTLRVERSSGNSSGGGYAKVHSTLTYQSEAGDMIEMHSHGSRLPSINGNPLNLAPEMTYSSPYLSNQYGSDTIELSHPLHDTLLLDFSE